MKRLHSGSKTRRLKAACTVSAAALMLGISHAATVGFNFQANYCSSAGYSGAPVTATAFGIDPSSWESLSQLDDGYGCDPGPFTLNEVIDTTSADGGLNPLPQGSLNVTWSAYVSNVSGFGGYDRSPPNYTFGGNGHHPGEEEVYWGFLRDGVNFGPGSSGGDNNQPGYNIDITGLKSVFGDHQVVVQLIASGDSISALTNAFIIDAALSTTQSVTYPNIPPIHNVGDTAWPRGVGGGLSTASGPMSTDHLVITGNRAQHAAASDDGTTEAFNNASTIAGFIITDKPVVTMPPQSTVAAPGDSITMRGLVIGVPPLQIQWRKDGAPISGATDLTYSIPTIGLTNGGAYDIVASNQYGSTTSKVATVTVDKLSVTTLGFTSDSSTSGTALDGQVLGANWLASSTDGANKARTGVMDFSAAQGDQIVVPVGDSTDLDSPIGTITFWMRSSGVVTTSGNEGAMLIDRRTGSGLVIVQHDDGTIFVQTTPSGANQFGSSGTVSDGKWHHIAVVYDQTGGDVTSIYIDGQPDSSNPNNTDWSWPTGQEVELGKSHDSYWRDYNGSLDDVRFYNRTLSDSEIALIASSDATIDDSALVLRLNFDASPVPGITVNWLTADASLESADVVSGPYKAVDAAVSPYSTKANGTQKFFRYSGHTPLAIITNPYDM